MAVSTGSTLSVVERRWVLDPAIQSGRPASGSRILFLCTIEFLSIQESSRDRSPFATGTTAPTYCSRRLRARIRLRLVINIRVTGTSSGPTATPIHGCMNLSASNRARRQGTGRDGSVEPIPIHGIDPYRPKFSSVTPTTWRGSATKRRTDSGWVHAEIDPSPIVLLKR